MRERQTSGGSAALASASTTEQPPGRSAWRAYDDVIGMNARNAHIARTNPAAAIRLVTDKIATKSVLARVGVPVAPTLDVIDDGRWARKLTVTDLPEQWVMKPNQGLGGTGILIAHDRDGGAWRRPSGRTLPLLAVKDHLRLLVDGEFSGRSRDRALLEPLIRAHHDVAALSHEGLADVRVICVDDQPKVAMLRLPTGRSGGRANLHQGAIGAAVDLDNGRIVAARIGHQEVVRHPDTDTQLLGSQLPHWEEILRAAARCGEATGLHYVGADVVVDEERGPLILEVNARPGLQIQNVTARGLSQLLGVIGR